MPRLSNIIDTDSSEKNILMRIFCYFVCRFKTYLKLQDHILIPNNK